MNHMQLKRFFTLTRLSLKKNILRKNTSKVEQKYRKKGVNNLNFYSIISKLGTKQNSSFSEILFVFEIFAFLAGKWRHEIGTKFWLC